MPFDSETLEKDLQSLTTFQGDVLDQLREVARQQRVIQMHIAALAGDRQPATAPTGRLPINKALSQDRVILLRKAVLGPNGGQRVRYHKDTAAQLLTKGIITAPQHRIWKLSGFLPESVNLREAQHDPVMVSRPA